MKIERGRPLIGIQDNPAIIATAVFNSIQANNSSGVINAEKSLWYHRALNNSESLIDHFGMWQEAEGFVPTELFPRSEEPCEMTMSSTELELALVIEGLNRINQRQPVEPIDDVLRKLDAARAELL